jgi:hypothetical protein
MKYRKKPVVIDAVKLGIDNIHIVEEFMSPCRTRQTDLGLEIKTLEGTMLAGWGDFIIMGVKGEFYPCKPDIFEATYDPVKPDPLSQALNEGDGDV